MGFWFHEIASAALIIIDHSMSKTDKNRTIYLFVYLFIYLLIHSTKHLSVVLYFWLLCYVCIHSPASPRLPSEALVSCQRSALAQIRQQASASHERGDPESGRGMGGHWIHELGLGAILAG